MQRRFYATLVITTFMFLSISTTANSYDPPPSGLCKKEGESRISIGQKFTCISYGDTLIWNKGETLLSNNKDLASKNSKVTTGQKCAPLGITRIYKEKEFRCTRLKGALVWSKGKKIISSKLEYQKPSSESDQIENCKINQISRLSANYYALATGFPVINPLTPRTGKVKWALIPIDFQDLRGEEDFTNRVNEQMLLTTKWYRQVSNGQLEIEWKVLPNWVTIPGNSSDYKVDFSDNPSRVPAISNFWQNAIKESDKYFDFSGIQVVNFILPKEQTIVRESMQGFPWESDLKNSNTNEGQVAAFTVLGRIFNNSGWTYWSYWAHEFGHTIGLAHVGSSRTQGPFHPMDMMGNQNGTTRELSGWLRFIVGWMPDEKVFCKNLENLSNLSIDLIPLNSKDQGFKMVVIRLSATKALIIESRRYTEFACRKDKTDNGVLAYIYDGNLNHAEEFLQPIIPINRPIKSVGCAVSPYANPIFTSGEEVEYEGIKIRVSSSSNLDRIEIKR